MRKKTKKPLLVKKEPIRHDQRLVSDVDAAIGRLVNKYPELHGIAVVFLWKTAGTPSHGTISLNPSSGLSSPEILELTMDSMHRFAKSTVGMVVSDVTKKPLGKVDTEHGQGNQESQRQSQT